MNKLIRRLHLPAVAALVGQLIGLTDLAASNPQVAQDVVLPHLGLSPEWAAVLLATCTLIQAFQRALHKGDQMEVPKGR